MGISSVSTKNIVSDALEEMSLDSELLKSGLLGSSFKTTADETLFLELARRGYDLSRLRKEEITTQIVKIG